VILAALVAVAVVVGALAVLETVLGYGEWRWQQAAKRADASDSSERTRLSA
jgi:hypothetical protein